MVLVLKTRNWLPGKTVVVPTDAFTQVDWFGRTINVALTRDEVKGAPEFSRAHLEDGTLREELRQYFATHFHT